MVVDKVTIKPISPSDPSRGYTLSFLDKPIPGTGFRTEEGCKEFLEFAEVAAHSRPETLRKRIHSLQAKKTNAKPSKLTQYSVEVLILKGILDLKLSEPAEPDKFGFTSPTDGMVSMVATQLKALDISDPDTKLLAVYVECDVSPDQARAILNEVKTLVPDVRVIVVPKSVELKVLSLKELLSQ